VIVKREIISARRVVGFGGGQWRLLILGQHLGCIIARRSRGLESNDLLHLARWKVAHIFILFGSWRRSGRRGRRWWNLQLIIILIHVLSAAMFVIGKRQ